MGRQHLYLEKRIQTLWADDNKCFFYMNEQADEENDVAMLTAIPLY